MSGRSPDSCLSLDFSVPEKAEVLSPTVTTRMVQGDDVPGFRVD